MYNLYVSIFETVTFRPRTDFIVQSCVYIYQIVKQAVGKCEHTRIVHSILQRAVILTSILQELIYGSSGKIEPTILAVRLTVVFVRQ